VAENQEAEDPIMKPGGTEKLLLVDDEEGIRNVLGISLADMGYQVLTAENAESAMELFRQAEPPIVLTDIKMPGMDGIELLRKLKSENPDTEVILITGHGDMDLAIRSLKYEATDFITKPIEDRELASALRKADERIQLRQQLRSYTAHLETLAARKSQPPTASGFEDSRFRRFFDEMPGYVTVIDPDFHMIAANRALQEDFQIPELGGARCHQVFKQSDEPCLDCPAALTFEDGASHSYERSLSLPAGETRRVFAWTAPVHAPSGDVSGAMIMMTDVSDILDLKDHLASLGLMVGSVSHGIKGLLTGLDGGLFMLKRGISKDNQEQVEEGMKTMRLMADRIKHMVLDILYYARESNLREAPVDIAEFSEDVASVVSEKAAAENIALNRRVRPGPDGREAVFDADQIRAALVNILENAVDACIEDREKAEHRIDFTVSSDTDTVCFEVEDNGPGMSEETKDNLFSLFYSSKAGKGAGIGLFITKKIVNQHGGEIEVSTTRGKGSRFRVRLPKGGISAEKEV
jgi:signal transduction histidine kinase/FixJ family two-component response regulator